MPPISSNLLTALVAVPAYVVAFALFAVMWLEHRPAREGTVAKIAGVALTAWAILATVLACRGAFVQPEGNTTPPVGINLPSCWQQ